VKTAKTLLLLALVISSLTSTGNAHVVGRSFILLLPTNLYIFGGAAVVAASFLLLAFIPAKSFSVIQRLRKRLVLLDGREAVRKGAPIGLSLLSFVFTLLLISAGWLGSRDPFDNPLPLFVWTVWFVGFTYLHALLGNLWLVLNPWTGVYRLLMRLPRMKRPTGPILRYPRFLGYWPSISIFFLFAWFELVHPAPTDTTLLANLAAVYLTLNFAGILLFGEDDWLQHAEAFSVYFRIISWLSPLSIHPHGHCSNCECNQSENCLNCHKCLTSSRPKQLDVTLPSLNLLSVGQLSLSNTVFVILALSTVSFDGFSRTFLWLSSFGVNPLEYPGRTALLGVNTFGLLLALLLLLSVYVAAVALSKIVGGAKLGVGTLLRLFIVSIVPIAFGYHLAHYLPSFLVNIQYVAKSISDPLSYGWNLLGTRDLNVTLSFLSDPPQLYTIWNTQVAIIVAAHVFAVYIAHLIALRFGWSLKTAILSQAPMTLLMIGYTMLGLWLLSTPATE